MEEQKPDARSSDLEGMMDYWRETRAILDGQDAMVAMASTFLPKMEDESEERYKLRKSVAKLTNIFADTVENLTTRAFAEKVVLVEGTSDPDLDELVEDIDGRGNSLHVVTGRSFEDGIAMGVDFILIDQSGAITDQTTVAEAKRLGIRPYWVRYPVGNVLAAELAMINGQADFVHARFLEITTKREGFKEVTETRVRVLNREDLTDPSLPDSAPRVYGPPMVSVWKKTKDEKGAEKWIVESEPRAIGLDYIPLVAFVTGQQDGLTWDIRPPMRSAVDLQKTLFRKETALEYATECCAFPMLTGNGVAPEKDEKGEIIAIKTGPGQVLYAPYTGEGGTPSWDTLEPSAASLKFMAEQIETTKRDARELGRQPLTAQSGNLTRVTTAFAAAKGNSAVQAWVQLAKDAYERALQITADWISSAAEPELVMAKDLDTSMREDDGFGQVLELRKNGDLSREAVLHEGKRRGVLDRDFDPEADAEAILAEIEADDGQEDDTVPGGSGQDTLPGADPGGDETGEV